MANIKLGISLFSFTNPYALGEYDLEGCFRAAREIGVEGIELVGAQMLDSYPYATEKTIGELAALCRHYALEPVCYGANQDKGMLPGRDLSDEEMFQRALTDLKTAFLLGFKVIRFQWLLGMDNFVKLAPYAKEYGLKIGIEIHNPETPSTPLTTELIRRIDESGADNLGLVMDFGCFATTPNKPHWDAALANGAPLELLEMARDLRYDGVPMPEAMQKLQAAGAPPSVMAAASGMWGFVQFTKEPDFEGLARVMPYIIHSHGKFHWVDETLTEASIPYDRVLKVYQDSDYDGYIVSECEGTMPDGSFNATKRHIMMEKKILGVT